MKHERTYSDRKRDTEDLRRQKIEKRRKNKRKRPLPTIVFSTGTGKKEPKWKNNSNEKLKKRTRRQGRGVEMEKVSGRKKRRKEKKVDDGRRVSKGHGTRDLPAPLRGGEQRRKQRCGGKSMDFCEKLCLLLLVALLLSQLSWFFVSDCFVIIIPETCER